MTSTTDLDSLFLADVLDPVVRGVLADALEEAGESYGCLRDSHTVVESVLNFQRKYAVRRITEEISRKNVYVGISRVKYCNAYGSLPLGWVYVGERVGENYLSGSALFLLKCILENKDEENVYIKLDNSFSYTGGACERADILASVCNPRIRIFNMHFPSHYYSDYKISAIMLNNGGKRYYYSPLHPLPEDADRHEFSFSDDYDSYAAVCAAVEEEEERNEERSRDNRCYYCRTGYGSACECI